MDHETGKTGFLRMSSAPNWLYIVRLISGLEHYYSPGTQDDGIVIILKLYKFRLQHSNTLHHRAPDPMEIIYLLILILKKLNI